MEWRQKNSTVINSYNLEETKKNKKLLSKYVIRSKFFLYPIWFYLDNRLRLLHSLEQILHVSELTEHSAL